MSGSEELFLMFTGINIKISKEEPIINRWRTQIYHISITNITIEGIERGCSANESNIGVGLVIKNCFCKNNLFRRQPHAIAFHSNMISPVFNVIWPLQCSMVRETSNIKFLETEINERQEWKDMMTDENLKITFEWSTRRITELGPYMGCWPLFWTWKTFGPLS